MSDYKVTFAPGFYLKDWPLKPGVRVGDKSYSYPAWAATEPISKPSCPNGLNHSDTESQGYCICETALDQECPACKTQLNEAQDRCARDGRLTCYRCGWKGPA